ncbi:integrase, catalytic region, zinc finger, CCHC-type containing protein [Tanacetum coccineum]
MSTQQDINAIRAQRIVNTHDPLALMANTQTPFQPDESSHITYIQHPQPNNNFVQQPSFNTNYMPQPMQNLEDSSDPTTAFNMALALMAKAFTLNDTTPTNNNQRSSSNPSSMQIAQPGMNMDQDRQMLMVEDIVGNQFRPNAMHNVGIQVVLNASQNPGVQNVGNQNGLSVVSEIANQHGDGNIVTAPPAEGNSNGINENRIRCYNCRGEDHYASNCTVKPRKLDAAYLQKQMQIAQKEEAGIQLTSEEFDFMAAAGACKETERANANYSLKNNLQQVSSSGTQSDEAPVYDSDRSAEVHHSENCYDNDIFNMFTQEEQYTELLEPIPEPHQVQQNNSNVISEVSSVEQSGGIVDQHPANVEETRAYFESLYNNLATEVEKVNLVNRKMKETNTELTTELASSGKQITTLNEEISNLSKQLSTEKSTVSSLLEEKKKLKSDFKIRKNELLDKQIQLENKIKELDNILVKTGQSIQTMHMLSPKPDSFYHTEQKMALGYQNPFYLKQAQQKQHSLYNGKSVLLEKADPPVFSEQVDTTKGTSTNTKFAKQSILGKPPSSSRPKLYAVTHLPNSTAFPKVGIFRINPFKATRVDNFVPNKHVKTSVRTKPIIVSQPHVITKNDVNSKTNGFSPKDIRSTTRTRRPKPWNNPKSEKVPFKSKSGCLSNKLEKIEENHRSLQSSHYPNHTSSECNNIKLAIRNEKSEVICATCKQCLITANHDDCVLQYVNGMKSRKKYQSANQKKHKAEVWKPKNVGSKEGFASPKPSKPRSCLRWSPTGRLFDLKGKSKSASESE